ncbi:MAG TPA: hypothetical protein VF719_09035, partial [Abditibacteriaceae bacterium]
ARQTVWYKWTAPSAGVVSLKFSDYEWYPPSLGVFTGTSVSTLTAVNLTSFSDTTRFTAVAGATYLIGVDEEDTTFTLNWRYLNRPANDNFASAQAVTGALGTVEGTTIDSTRETNEPGHGNMGVNSIWYKWTPATSGNAVFTAESNVPAYLGVYTGTTVAGLTPLVSPAASQIRFTATAGVTYRIAVASFENAVALNWRYSQAPANDNFASARILTGAAGAVDGTTYDATRQTGEPTHGDSESGSIWYKWTAPTTGFVGFESDRAPSIYTGTSLTALTPVNSTTVDEEIRFKATAAAVYYIAVIKDYQTDIRLGWRYLSRPLNDDFASAATISGAAGAIDGTTVDATRETGEPLHNGDNQSGTIWYKWTPATSGKVVLDSDANLSVYTGTALNALTKTTLETTWGDSRFTAAAGTVYLIALADGDNSTVLSWRYVTVPANDNFAAGVVLAGNNGTTSGTTIDATRETGEPGHGNTSFGSVWYKWAPTVSGTAVLRADAANVRVYTGSAANALTWVATGTNYGEVRFKATAATVYRIAVVSEQKTFNLRWRLFAPPANDNFAAAATLTGAPGSITGTTVGATRESGEPAHNNYYAGSVWYKWTPTTSGRLLFKVNTGTANTASIGVYTGTTVSGLQRVATPAYDAIRFAYTANTTYQIAVAASDKPFTLTWRVATPPLNDNFAAAQLLSGNSGSIAGTTLDATREAGEPLHDASSVYGSVWYKWSPAANGTFVIDGSGEGGIYTGSTVGALTEVPAIETETGIRV